MPVRRPASKNHKDPMALLHTEHLDMRFGGLSALEDLNLAVPAGGIYGLIGPNGAGKTTVFNLISGFLKPTGGRIIWDGKDATRQDIASGIYFIRAAGNGQSKTIKVALVR